MSLPMIDEYHRELCRMVEQITNICLSNEFLALKKELEAIYDQEESRGQTTLIAFQDALYAIIAQGGSDLSRSQD